MNGRDWVSLAFCAFWSFYAGMLTMRVRRLREKLDLYKKTFGPLNEER